MAIWQFQLELIPQEIAKAEALHLGSIVTADRREKICKWESVTAYKETFNYLPELLPRGKSWHKDLMVFGDMDSTCITIMSEEGKVLEIHLRLDLRTVTANLINGVLDFAQSLNSWLITDAGKIIESTFSAVADEIKKSPAYRYVRNPIGFIEELNNS